MRIAIVSPYDLTVPGGVQQHVEHLAGALADHGDDVLVLGPGPRDLDRLREDVARVGVGPSTAVPFNDSVAPLALVPTAVRHTLAELKRFAPDVVHVHEPAVPWVSLTAVTRGPRPVVGTFHAWSDSDAAYRLARPVLRRLLRRLDGHIAVSRAAAGFHAAALGLPEGSFRLVPNGVDVARFRDAEPFADEVDPDRPLLLFVGRLEKRKGAEVAVRAFVRLKATHPRARLVVVGDGPERARCEALVPSALRDDVRFLGRVPDEDVPRWFRTADLYLAPALGGESFGIVLIEAMAARTPVLASDIPGYAGVVDDGTTGVLTPPGNANALAVAAGDLLANPDRRRSLVEAAAAEVDAFDWRNVARRVRDVLGKAVLREHARRSGQRPPEVHDA